MIENLKNLGPKCLPLLEKAGITTRTQLKQRGAEEAFVQIWEANHGKVHLNAMMLYALEGAILDINCLEIPIKRQEELKKFMKTFRESLK